MSPVPKPPIQDPDPGLPGPPQDSPIDRPLDPPVQEPQDNLALHRTALGRTLARSSWPARSGPTGAVHRQAAAATA